MYKNIWNKIKTRVNWKAVGWLIGTNFLLSLVMAIVLWDTMTIWIMNGLMLFFVVPIVGKLIFFPSGEPSIEKKEKERSSNEKIQ